MKLFFFNEKSEKNMKNNSLYVLYLCSINNNYKFKNNVKILFRFNTNKLTNIIPNMGLKPN